MNKQLKILLIVIGLLFIVGLFLLLFFKNSFIFQQNKKLPNLNSQVEQEKPKTLKILFFGDLMLDRNVLSVIQKRGLNYIFEKTPKQTWEGYDLVGSNLEGAVTEDGRHYNPQRDYDFAFKPEYVNQLKEYGFNVFNLANNHALDQGWQGVSETYQNLNNLEFNYFGSPDGLVDKNSCQIIEKNSLKIGFCGFSMTYSVLNESDLEFLIAKTKKQSDLLIASIHWGVEYEHIANSTQKEIAYQMIDWGVDIILGHHPHVVQGLEIYKEKPIFYSLGNFIFDQYFSKDTQEGIAVGIDFNGQIADFEIKPFKSVANRIIFLEGQEEEEFLKRFNSYF